MFNLYTVALEGRVLQWQNALAYCTIIKFYGVSTRALLKYFVQQSQDRQSQGVCAIKRFEKECSKLVHFIMLAIFTQV